MTIVRRAARLVAATAAFTLLSAPSPSLAEPKIGWNIKRAAVVMDRVRTIQKRSLAADYVPRIFRDIGVYKYREFNNRFREDIDFLMAASPSHVYIGFKGTHNDANKRLNRTFIPIRPVSDPRSTVHSGWWNTARKAYRNEIKAFLDAHAAGKKILVTGHSLGGALAAYTLRQIQLDPDHRRAQLRLVTFGAPRYTNNSRFFDLGKNVWVFTMELAKANRCVDKTVYSWQASLVGWVAATPLAISAVTAPHSLTAPRNVAGDQVWFGRCKTDITNYSDLHSLDTYRNYSKRATCQHIALRRDCKTTAVSARAARN